MFHNNCPSAEPNGDSRGGGFHSHLMNMSEYFKLPDFNPDLLDVAMVKSYASSMKQEYILAKHSQKLEF